VKFHDEILNGIDCRLDRKDSDVTTLFMGGELDPYRFPEKRSGRISYYLGNNGGIHWWNSIIEVVTGFWTYPVVSVSGLSQDTYDPGLDYSQSSNFRTFCLGSFAVDYVTPVYIDYDSCVNGVRRFKWTALMYVEDDLGVDESGAAIFNVLAKSRRVKRAQWLFSGFGVCDCCSGEKVLSFSILVRTPVQYGYGKY